MSKSSKEISTNLSELWDNIGDKEILSSLSLLEEDTRTNVFKEGFQKISDWIKNLFKDWWSKENQTSSTDSSLSLSEDSKEGEKKWWNTISNGMFNQLLEMEGKIKKGENLVAKSEYRKFWESFATWPYGMVYKHIDMDWNLLKKPVPFKENETVTEKRAKDNAKAYYNKKAEEWKHLLDREGCEFNQNQLDALVSASWGTIAATKRLESFVLTHWNKPDEISNFMSNFAVTSKNGQVQKGLIRRRKFEANRFMWNKKLFSEYKA